MNTFLYPIQITHMHINGIVQSHYDLGDLGSADPLAISLMLVGILVSVTVFYYLCKAAWWILKLLIGLSIHAPQVISATIDTGLDTYFGAKRIINRKINNARDRDLDRKPNS
ncbi:MAG: hypothetical protein MN733_12415 [Nitrososphaera sp.]|nr:hypothetical protein [Nitrososphaera sp.]